MFMSIIMIVSMLCGIRWLCRETSPATCGNAVSFSGKLFFRSNKYAGNSLARAALQSRDEFQDACSSHDRKRHTRKPMIEVAPLLALQSLAEITECDALHRIKQTKAKRRHRGCCRRYPAF